MVLKFPSGRASVSIRELQKQQQTQKGCGICDELWVVVDHECIGNQLRVFHPCQHIVGSQCWSSVPDKKKGRCPVCKVKIRCDEKIDVHAKVDRCAPTSSNSRSQEPEKFLILTQDPPLRAQALELEDGKENGQEKDIIMAGKEKEGLDDVDAEAFMYFMNLQARLHYIKDGLGLLQAETKTLTPIRRDRLIRFLANVPQTYQGRKKPKIDVAMFSSGGKYFTMDDLRKTLSSAEELIKENFAAVRDGKGRASKDAVSLRKLEMKLADVQAEIEELKDLQSRESARLREVEAIRWFTEKAEEEVLGIRAEADDKVLKIRAKASAEIAKLQSNGNVVEI